MSVESSGGHTLPATGVVRLGLTDKRAHRREPITDFGHYPTLLVRDCSIVGTEAKSANLYGPSRFRDGRYRVLVSLPGHWHYPIKSVVFHAMAENEQ